MFGLGDNKFDPEQDVPDLSGKVFVLTGGSAGIGFGIAAHILSHKPAALYILARNPAHLSETKVSLKDWGETSVVHTIECDLSFFATVSKVAAELSKTLSRLDGLILNAGLGVGPFAISTDDIDTHMQVNHISQFHLAMTLLPLLSTTPGSRLVLQSSEFHRFDSSSTFTSRAELNKDIGPSNLYGRTKLAQLLFVRALVRRKREAQLPGVSAEDTAAGGPIIIACHPGGVKTDQQEQAVEAYGTLGKLGVAAARPFLKDPVEQGCRPVLFAATSKEVEAEPGKYMGAYIVPDKKVAETSKTARDDERAESLWKLTEELLRDGLGKEAMPYKTFYV